MKIYGIRGWDDDDQSEFLSDNLFDTKEKAESAVKSILEERAAYDSPDTVVEIFKEADVYRVPALMAQFNGYELYIQELELKGHDMNQTSDFVVVRFYAEKGDYLVRVLSSSFEYLTADNHDNFSKVTAEDLVEEPEMLSEYRNLLAS